MAAAMVAAASTLLFAQSRFAAAYEEAIDLYRNGDYTAAEQKFLESINTPGAPTKRGASVRLASQQRGFYPEMYLAFTCFQLREWQQVVDYAEKAKRDVAHDNPLYDTLISTENEAKKALLDPNYNPDRSAAIAGRRVTPPDSTVPGPAHALVVGINHYNDAALPTLTTAIDDATEISSVLSGDYGFKTKLLIDATRNQIIDALDEYAATLDESSSLLIYYAGHGSYDDRAQRAFWLPRDAAAAKHANWIAADDITRAMNDIPSRHIIVVSDSCYSGGLTREAPPPAYTNADHDAYIRRSERDKSRNLLSSGELEPVSDRGASSSHSVFADALLRGLKQMPRDQFTSLELFRDYVSIPVAGRSQQSPQYAPIRNSGHVGGDFVFRRKKPS